MLLPTDALDVGAILIGLFGGLSLFLYGMGQMTDALKSVAGEGMRRLIARLTGNRFTAALTGAFVTVVIQSSSVTTVLVVGFITAGLLTLAQSVGVILGANVGTTVTAQIIAFDVTEYALVLVTIGFALQFAVKREPVKRLGAMIMGLGLIFYGMGLMSEATGPLRTYEPFIDVMRRMDVPLFGILAGAAFTALVQSSSATTGIVIVLAGQGFITLEAGIALALGANVGTSVTAILASLGKPRPARQAALVHVLFNVVGALLWLPFIGHLVELVVDVSPAYPDLESTARLAAETPRQIANAHTAFNLINLLVFLPFTTALAGLVQRILPDRPEPEPERIRPQFLDPVYLDTPALALDALRQEVLRYGDLVAELVDGIRTGPFDRSAAEERAAATDDLNAEIVSYTREMLVRGKLTSRDSHRLEGLMEVTNYLQSMADTVAVNLGSLFARSRQRHLQASDETRARFHELGGRIANALRTGLDALRDGDLELAKGVVSMKPEIERVAESITAHLGARLAADAPERLHTYRLESQVIEVLRRLYYFAKRIAKAVPAAVGEPEASPETPPDSPTDPSNEAGAGAPSP